MIGTSTSPTGTARTHHPSDLGVRHGQPGQDGHVDVEPWAAAVPCHPWWVAVPDTITCVDCGGTCRRVPLEPPELGWRPGDVVTYRCRECLDVWYLEVDADDLDGLR